MTKEEAIRCLSVHSSTNGSGLCTDEQHYEAKQMAIKALEQEPSGDLISKQAVLKIIDGWYENNLDTKNIEDLIILITYMASVTPQPKIGRWISVNKRLPETDNENNINSFNVLLWVKK